MTRGRLPGYGNLGPPTLGMETTCTCGHSWTVHAIGTRAGVKVRTTCSTGSPAGPCPCRQYQRQPDAS